MKRRIAMSMLPVLLVWLVLSWVFMWPPVVWEFHPAAAPCVNTLRRIDGAKEQWAMAENKPNDAIPTSNDISPYIAGGWESLECPDGGRYAINRLGEDPTCSLATNSPKKVRVSLFMYVSQPGGHRHTL